MSASAFLSESSQPLTHDTRWDVEGCNLADINLNALCQAHIHDAALDRALTVELGDLDRLAYVDLSESFFIACILLLIYTVNSHHDLSCHFFTDSNPRFLDVDYHVAAE